MGSSPTIIDTNEIERRITNELKDELEDMVKRAIKKLDIETYDDSDMKKVIKNHQETIETLLTNQKELTEKVNKFMEETGSKLKQIPTATINEAKKSFLDVELF